MALNHYSIIQFGQPSGLQVPRLFNWAVMSVAYAAAALSVLGGVVINEIHYHPQSGDILEEFIELYNTGSEAVNLEGWSLRRGVRFDFPKATVLAGGYLVVAANPERFTAKYPSVQPVVAGWNGQLSNRGDTVVLEDADGKTVDWVTYADEGDWAVRQRGQPHHQHQGWDWLAEHDGGGRSLELINPSLSNKYGQNWASSFVEAGTPGAANSVFSIDIPPMILEVRHSPIVPRSTSRVRITARLLDEKNGDLTAFLYFRPDSEETFQSLPLLDDGAHGDGIAGDGLFGQAIPAYPDGTVVEFYVQANDAQNNSRSYPAVSVSEGEARANLIYQVDDAVVDDSMPLYRIIMTRPERDYFLEMLRHPIGQYSDARMNATFVSRTNGKEQTRYLVDIRNRGNGSRWPGTPNNYRVDFPSDVLWQGVEKINLNAQYPHIQLLGSALCQQAGLLVSRSRLVRVRLNSIDTALPTYPMFGSYAHNDVVDDDFADYHKLGPVNIYRTNRTKKMEADFDYLGAEPEPYRQVYFKDTNASKDDWRDLIDLCWLLTKTPKEEFVASAEKSIDVDNWLRFFAINTFFDNMESSLGNGIGDDFIHFKDLSRNQHMLVPYDLDSILGRGESPGSPTAGLFKAAEPVYTSGHMTKPDQVARFLKHPAFVPGYFSELQRQAETIFSEDQFPSFVEQVLGGLVDQSEIELINRFIDARREFIMSEIPQELTLSTDLPLKQGHRISETNHVALEGRANAMATHSVTINGIPANWSAWEAKWTVDAFELQPGLNHLSVTAFDANHGELDRLELTVWNEQGAQEPVSEVNANIMTNTFLSATDGPWFISGKTIVQKQAILSVEAGAIVYFGKEAQLEVHGGLMIDGTPDRRTILTCPPGSGHQWRGIRWVGSDHLNRLSYVNISCVSADAPLVEAKDSHLNLIGVTFGDLLGTAIEYSNSTLLTSDCSFEVSESETDINAPIVIGSGFAGDDHIIFRDNHFPAIERAAPIFVFDGHDQLDAWLELRGNRFLGGMREACKLSRCNSFLWENSFRNFRHPESLAKRATAVSIDGTNTSDRPSIVFACNYFSETDVAMTLAGRMSLEVQNNLFTDCKKSVAEFVDHPETNKNAWVNNLYDRCSELFLTSSTVDVNYSLFVQTPFRSGDGNIEVSASEAAAAKGMGLFGGDIGPGGERILIAGAPVSPTPRQEEILIIWGPGLSHYRYRLDDEEFGEPIPIAEPLLIPNAARGKHTIEVIGQDVAGEWMQSPHSMTWTVNSEASPILISEVMAVGDDWVEIHNRSHFRINISGMSLTDDLKAPTKFIFPDGTELEAGGLMVLPGGNRGAPGSSLGFSVKNGGESVALFDSAAQGGRLLDVVVFGPQIFGHSIALFQKGWGLAYPSPKKPNKPAPVGPASTLKINEWFTKSSGLDNEDFVELFNNSPLPVALQGLALTDQPLRQTTHGSFPALSFIAGGASLAFLANNREQQLGFELSSDQGLIGLFDSAGSLIDQVWYAPQRPGESTGRVPDGASNIEVKTATTGVGLGLVINELLADNRSFVGAADDYHDWVELHNPQADPVELSGMGLSTSLDSPHRFIFSTGSIIPAGGYFLLSCNPEKPTSDANTGFGLKSTGDALYLHDTKARGGSLLDSIVFGFQSPDLALGRHSSDAGIWSPCEPSPGSANKPFLLGDSAKLRINEWMASPQTGEDWFELHNTADLPIDLGGFFLSDDPANKSRHRIPAHSYVDGNIFAYRKIIADGEPNRGADHVSFKLRASGESITLHDSNGFLVDEVTFNSQSMSISEGRYPDGSNYYTRFLAKETPGEPNYLDLNSNGLPDDWEIIHNLATENHEVAVIDTDGDGQTNIEEYFSGTDPRDATSHLSFEIISIKGDKVYLEFMAYPGIAYRLLAIDDLLNGKWITICDIKPKPTSGFVSIEDVVHGIQKPNRYYLIEGYRPVR